MFACDSLFVSVTEKITHFAISHFALDASANEEITNAFLSTITQWSWFKRTHFSLSHQFNASSRFIHIFEARQWQERSKSQKRTLKIRSFIRWVFIHSFQMLRNKRNERRNRSVDYFIFLLLWWIYHVWVAVISIIHAFSVIVCVCSVCLLHATDDLWRALVMTNERECESTHTICEWIISVFTRDSKQWFNFFPLKT